ncbi:NUDIX hydrolase [Paenibacillus senegalensis]|uniref:NUDIX hydrolase n=1 Tax=Paenibacillus senegalensis TaxID=1465766 RepID=UPI00028A40A9
MIISAGGVVYRKENGVLQIQMIQDRYGKITLPKGKMEPGETVEQTALREIKEETGIVGKIRRKLEVISYQVTDPATQQQTEKQVHYYLVEAVGGKLAPQVEEIRGVEWLEPEKAWLQQTAAGYDNNHSVLRKALSNFGIEVK